MGLGGLGQYQGDALALKIDDEIILCLRMDAAAPFLEEIASFWGRGLSRLFCKVFGQVTLKKNIDRFVWLLNAPMPSAFVSEAKVDEASTQDFRCLAASSKDENH